MVGRRIPVVKHEGEREEVVVGTIGEESAKVLCGEDVVRATKVLIVNEDRGAESDIHRRVHEFCAEDLEVDGFSSQ